MNFKLIEFQSNRPVYIQIMDFIKKQIINGDIKLGEKLPSVRELAGEVEVNVNTAQRVYKELEREGITMTKRGLGTFITEDENIKNSLKDEMAKQIVDHFLKDMRDMGYNKDSIIKILSERG